MNSENMGSMNSRTGSSVPANGDGGKTDLNAQAKGALSKLGEAAQEAGSQVKETAASLAKEAGNKAKGFIDAQVHSGADFLESIGRSAKAAADSLDPDAPQLAGLLRGMATSVGGLSESIRGQSPDALLETAFDYVRQNPALVLSAAAVCGFALARLLQGGAWNGSRSTTRAQNSGTMGRPNAF
jgi:ElaB/YqjD/DUF883 family membrane-anchored ribosome-binding protein